MKPESKNPSPNVWSRAAAVLLAAAIIFLVGRFTAPHAPARASDPTAAQAAPLIASSAAVKIGSSNPLPPAKIEEWRRRLDAGVPGEARGKERLRMLSEWARVSPTAALEYVRQKMFRDRQPEALTTVFEAWAGQDPTAAWNWVLTRENGDAGHLRSVLTEVAKNDPVMAQRLAGEYAGQHPDLASNAYLSALDGVMYTGDYEGAQRMIAQAKVPNEEQRNILLNLLAGNWARYQPESAAQWVLNLPAGAVRAQALDALGQAWSDIDPPRAAEFAMNLPPGPERQTALKQAISKWTMDDPLRASEWVLKCNAHGDFDQAIAALATSSDVMNHNVDLALGWAGTIQQENLRRQSTIAIVSTWYSTDPASAMGYIKGSADLSPETRQELLKVFPAAN